MGKEIYALLQEIPPCELLATVSRVAWLSMNSKTMHSELQDPQGTNIPFVMERLSVRLAKCSALFLEMGHRDTDE